MSSKPLICTACNGEMNAYVGPRFNKKAGVCLIVAGVFCCLFWIGMVLGIPLLVAGIYMTSAKRQLWVCEDCNIALERVTIKRNSKQA